MNLKRRRLVPALVIPLVLIAAPLAGQDRAFSIDDAINLSSVGGPVLSPDGSRLLYIRTELDWGGNDRNRSIWMMNADGSDDRRYTSGDSDSGPQWSPDGRWVSFLRNTGSGDDRTRQVFLLRTDGGEARQLTKHPTSVGRYGWSDDGSRIFYVANDSIAPEVRKARKDGADGVFVDEGPNGQTRGEWNGIWSVALDFDALDRRRHTPEKIRVGSMAVSPDGGWLGYVFRSENHRNDEFRSEIAIVGTGEGAEPRVMTSNEAPESNLAWSPNGEWLTFVAPDLENWELDQGNLYAMDPQSGDIRKLYGDQNPDMNSYSWAPDGESVLLVALDRTDTQIYRLDVGSGDVDQISRSSGVFRGFSIARDHSAMAMVLSNPTSPGDLYTTPVSGLSPSRVTDINPWMAERSLVEPEVVRWTSSDGLEIEGLLYRPAGADEATAMILEIHGGPAGVFSRGFDAEAQLMTSRGYAVLQPNVRGSSGYGDDLLRGNMNDIGGGDFDDLMTGVDAMIDQGVAHADSLGVKGWSYGGILGGWTITRTNRFKAASLGAMVADWRSEFGTGFNFDVNRWYLGGDPWSERDQWLERSAYTHLDQVSTPTILFHGDNDTTDTVEQSMNFFQGLRYLGVDTRFVRFPREGHGIAEPRHRRTLLVEDARWFEIHLRGNPDWVHPDRPEDTDEKKAAVS
jgi:dipeptidyl aminopeptidase/acylaminoacyl peptidase